MNQRLMYIDALKGFAILLMVMGHAIAWNYSDWSNVVLISDNQPDNVRIGGLIWQLIYSFHMPLFFFISGFFAYNSKSNKNIFQKFKDKVSRLFIPYMATGYLCFFVRGTWGYWFLLSLFELSIVWIIIDTLLNRINKQNSLLFDIIFIVLLCVSFAYLPIQNLKILGVEVGKFLAYNNAYAMGYIIKKHNSLLNIVTSQHTFTLTLTTFVVLFVDRYILFCGPIEFLLSKFQFLLPLCGCVLFLELFRKGINPHVENILAIIGKNSLSVYILHILFVLQIPQVGNFILNNCSSVTSVVVQIVYSLVVAILAISLSLIVYSFLKNSRLIDRVFFGAK